MVLPARLAGVCTLQIDWIPIRDWNSQIKSTTSRPVATNRLNPYQGLKRGQLAALGNCGATNRLNPYQGLKRRLRLAPPTGRMRYKSTESLSGIETTHFEVESLRFLLQIDWIPIRDWNKIVVQNKRYLNSPTLQIDWIPIRDWNLVRSEALQCNDTATNRLNPYQGLKLASITPLLDISGYKSTESLSGIETSQVPGQ